MRACHLPSREVVLSLLCSALLWFALLCSALLLATSWRKKGDKRKGKENRSLNPTPQIRSAFQTGLLILAQVLGAVAGDLLVRASVPTLLQGGAISTGVPQLKYGSTNLSALMLEALCTFFLVFIIFSEFEEGAVEVKWKRVGGLATGRFHPDLIPTSPRPPPPPPPFPSTTSIPSIHPFQQ